MTPHTSRDEQVFVAALSRPERERAEFLDGACAGDVPLKEWILALLKAHAGLESLMIPSATSRATVSSEEKPGDTIGRYKLLQVNSSAALPSACNFPAHPLDPNNPVIR